MLHSFRLPKPALAIPDFIISALVQMALMAAGYLIWHRFSIAHTQNRPNAPHAPLADIVAYRYLFYMVKAIAARQTAEPFLVK
jgi:hypothetical protein